MKHWDIFLFQILGKYCSVKALEKKSERMMLSMYSSLVTKVQGLSMDRLEEIFLI